MKCIVAGVLMCFAIHAVSYAQTGQEKSVKILLSSDRECTGRAAHALRR